ncbi:MAG: HAD-IIIA family hydrolase [Oligoflexia bacterium]|nr:HAD-IIIA family hydrolase [Oligoflexia bacterium]
MSSKKLAIKKNPAIFLDRDGVINLPLIKEDNRPYSPSSLDEFVFCEGIIETIKAIKENEMGFLVIVVTNQPDVARGLKQKENIELIHQHIIKQTLVDKIYCCYHDNSDNCECRKPKVGLFQEAQQKYSIDFERSFMVGDRRNDMLAGRKLHLKNIFINYNYSETLPTTDEYDFIINKKVSTINMREILKFI